MKYLSLVVFAAASVCALAWWMLDGRPVSAQMAPTVAVYNPYPPGILPSDLDSEIARVRREVSFIENEAIAEWHKLPAITFTGQPPTFRAMDMMRCESWASS